MPPDVFLMLASSGLTLVASLMFFVSEDTPPKEAPVDRRKPQLTFCLPPRRARLQPPPLPRTMTPSCEVNFTQTSVMTFRPSGDEWEVTLEVTPVADTPALQVQDDGEASGAVHDLRWHGKAGLPKSIRRTWKQKPGRA